jgi:hypothetical protein
MKFFNRNKKAPDLYPDGRFFLGMDMAKEPQDNLQSVYDRIEKPFFLLGNKIEIGQPYKDSDKAERMIGSKYIVSLPIYIEGELEATASIAISGYTKDPIWSIDGKNCRSVGGSDSLDGHLVSYIKAYLED